MVSSAARSVGTGVLVLCLLAGGMGAPLATRATFGHGPTTSSTFSTAANW